MDETVSIIITRRQEKEVKAAISRRVSPDGKKSRASPSNDGRSLQSGSSDLKTKFATQGWPYNPSVDDVINRANANERPQNLPSEKNKAKNKTTDKTKNSDEKIKKTTNVMQYGNDKSALYQPYMKSGKLTECDEDKYIKSKALEEMARELQPYMRDMDSGYDVIQKPLRSSLDENSDDDISEKKGEQLKDLETLRFNIDMSLRITKEKLPAGIEESENLDKRKGYKSDGIEELCQVNPVSDEARKSNPESGKRNFEKFNQVPKYDKMAQSQTNKTVKYNIPELHPPNEHDLTKCKRQKHALLSKSPGFSKEKSVPTTTLKYLYGNITEQYPKNESTVLEINENFKESTYYDGEETKENTRVKNSLQEDFVAYIGSLEDIVSITKREKKPCSEKKPCHKSLYDKIVFKQQKTNLSNNSLKSNQIQKSRNYSSSEESLKKDGPNTDKYTEDKQNPFKHQKYYLFSERVTNNRLNTKPLRRSSSEEVISNFNKNQEYNSDKNKIHKTSSQSQPQERKKKFDFSKYIKLNQPSSEKRNSKEGKPQEEKTSRKKTQNYKPLYRTSSEEIYKHIRESDEEKTLGSEKSEQDNSHLQPKQRKLSKYEKFYQSSEELLSQYNIGPYSRSQLKPTEKAQRLRKESFQRDKKLGSSSDYEKKKKKGYFDPMLKEKGSVHPRENYQNKLLFEEPLHKKSINAQDEGELNNRRRGVPTTLDDVSMQNHATKISLDFNRENQKSYDNTRNKPDNKIDDKDREISNTYDKNISIFEKLIQSIMSKCHPKNEYYQNIQPSKVTYLSLKSALLFKSPGYSRHKPKRHKHKHIKNPIKVDYPENESTITKNYQKKGGSDYIKNKFIKKKSLIRVENEYTRNENQYPSSSDEISEERFNQIKEYYTEISDTENAKEKPLYRSVSEELINKQVTGFDDDSLAVEQLQSRRITDRYYPKEQDNQSSEKHDKNSSLSKKIYNKKVKPISINEKYERSRDKPYQSSSDEVISKETKYKPDKNEKLRLIEKGQESKGNYYDVDNKQRKRDFNRERLMDDPDYYYDRSTTAKPVAEYKSIKPDYLDPTHQTMSTFDKLKQAIMAKCRLKEKDEIQSPKDISNEPDEKHVLSKRLKEAEEIQNESQEKLKKKYGSDSPRSSLEDTTKRHDKHPDSRENRSKVGQRPEAIESLKSNAKNNFESRKKRDRQERPDDKQQYRSSSEEINSKGGKNEEKLPDYKKNRSNRKGPETKELYDDEGHPKQYKTSSEDINNEVIELLEPKEKGKRHELAGANQRSQSSSDEIIRTRKGKKTLDNNENEKRKGIREYENDSRDQPRDRSQFQSSSEELVYKKHQAGKEALDNKESEKRKRTREHENDSHDQPRDRSQHQSSSEETVFKKHHEREKSVDYERGKKRDKIYESSSDEEISERVRNVNKDRRPDKKKPTEGRYKTEEAIIKENKGYRPKDNKNVVVDHLEPKEKGERHELSGAKQRSLASSDVIITTRKGKQKETLDNNENGKRKGTREYENDPRDQPPYISQHQSLPEETVDKKHQKREKGELKKRVKGDYERGKNQDKMYESPSDEGISEREMGLNKSRRSEIKTPTKGRSKTEEVIIKENKGYRPQDETHQRSSPKELDYNEHKQQNQGPGYEKGETNDMLDTKDIADRHKQPSNKSEVDSQAKDTELRRKKNREEELYSPSSHENYVNTRKKQKHQLGDKDKLGIRDGVGDLKKTVLEEEQVKLKPAMTGESYYASFKKIDNEDLKSKLERQREALFAKCTGFEPEAIPKRDNTSSDRDLIHNKINKSKSDDESQDYDQNKMKSPSDTKEKTRRRRAKSFDRSSLDDISKYENLQKKSYDYEKESPSYSSSSKEALKKEEKQKGRSTAANIKNENLYSPSSKESLPKPKKHGKIDDQSEEMESKKKDKDHNLPHKKPLSSSYEEGTIPSKDKKVKDRQIHDTRQHYRSSYGENTLESKESSTLIKSEPQKQELLPSFSDLGDWNVDPSVIITKKSGLDILKEQARVSGPEESKYNQGQEKIPGMKKRDRKDDRSDENIVGKRIKDKYKAGQEDLKDEKDDSKRETMLQEKKEKYDTNEAQYASYEEGTIPSKDKKVNDRQIHDTRQHYRSSYGENTLESKESSTLIKSEPQKQELLPSFSELGDWHVDPSVIITKKSGLDILKEQARVSGLEESKYNQGQEKIPGMKRREREDDRSDENSVGKRIKDKYKAGQEDLKDEKDDLRRETMLQEKKDKYDTNEAQKQKEKKDKLRPGVSIAGVDRIDKYKAGQEDLKDEKDDSRPETMLQEKKDKYDTNEAQKQKEKKNKLRPDVSIAEVDRMGTAQFDKNYEKTYSPTKPDKINDVLSDPAKTKRLDALKDSMKSKDIEKEKDADSKKEDTKLEDGRPLELGKQRQGENFEDSKQLKDSAISDSKTGDSQKSKQYDEEEVKKNSIAIPKGTKNDLAKHLQSEDLLATDDPTKTKGGKKLDIYGVPLEVFEELREQELRVINQRADSREEPDREPTRMLSVPSAEKVMAQSTKEGQKGKGKLSRRPSQISEGEKSGEYKDGKRTSISGSSRKSQDIEEEKILVVERIPLDKEKAREYKEKHKGTPLSVVKLEEFEALVKEVKELDARMRPATRFSFPGNAEFLKHIRSGASLTEAMGALQLSARIEAAENTLENIIEMVTKLAAQNPEVDIDKNGQPVVKIPAKQGKKQVQGKASKPMDNLGFDALAPQQTETGAKCREGCITKPEFDQEILKVQKELAKEIGESAKKNLAKIDVLAKNLRHLESKVEDAFHMANRMSNLEDSVAGYSERINAMDTGLSVQMTSYQDQLTQMQHELEEGLENMAETLANAEGDPAAVAELHVKLNILQDDLINTSNIQSELGKNEQDVFANLKDLFTQIEHLRETKADREEVEDALQNKAGLSALNGLISLEHFDALIGDMESHIGKAYDKFNNQELIWQKAINDLVKELNEKTNLEIVLNLRDDINKNLNMIMERISDLRNIVGEPKAFGTTKRLNIGTECISCKTPAQMEPEAKPTRMKSTSASGAGAYMKEAGDACYPGYPIPHPLEQRTHICNRYCGGSHTMLKNVTRAKSLPGAVTIQKWEKPSPAAPALKSYMVEDPSVRGPCGPCNIVPSVSTIEIHPKPSAPVKGRAVFNIEIRESDKCSCFNVEPELDSDVTLTG